MSSLLRVLRLNSGAHVLRKFEHVTKRAVDRFVIGKGMAHIRCELHKPGSDVETGVILAPHSVWL